MSYKEATKNDGINFVVKYFTICEQRKSPAPGFDQVETFNPTTKEQIIRYIKPYSEIEAFVQKMSYRDTEDKFDVRYVSWQLELIDEHGEPATLNIDLNSSVASRFMMTAEQIDWSKMVIFRAWEDKQKEQSKTAFLIAQGRHGDGKPITVLQKYTKEHMGDCPPAKKTVRGWSFDDQEEFLINQMLTVVVPAVDAAAAARGGAQPPQERPASQPPQPRNHPEPETPATQPAASSTAPSTLARRERMNTAKRNMFLALARGSGQDSDGVLDATIKGFFPGETLETLIAEEADIIMGYFREMMATAKK